MMMTMAKGIEMFGKDFRKCYKEFDEFSKMPIDGIAGQPGPKTKARGIKEDAWEARWTNEKMKEAAWCLRYGEEYED